MSGGTLQLQQPVLADAPGQGPNHLVKDPLFCNSLCLTACKNPIVPRGGVGLPQTTCHALFCVLIYVFYTHMCLYLFIYYCLQASEEPKAIFLT